MNDSKTRLDRFNARIRNNPVIALLILLGTLIIALSTLTNAARNLLGLVSTEQRPDINGDWTAAITYDWNDTASTETFRFGGEGTRVYGTATLQGSSKAIAEGHVEADTLRFVTSVQEVAGDWNNPNTILYRYQGRILDDEIRFVLQIEGGTSGHAPVEFSARKAVAGTDTTEQNTR